MTTDSTTVSIVNADPSISSVTNSGPIDEGSSATIIVNASDPGGAGDPLQYQFDCDNDSTYEVGPQASNSTSCSFADNGSFPVNARVTDDDGGSATSSTTVVVNNVPPTITDGDLSLDDDSISEGDTASLGGSFTDPGTLDTHTVSIDWGDGSTDTTFSLGANVLTFSGKTHQYLDDPSGTPDTYTITVTVTDKDSGSDDATSEITVANVAPTISSLGAGAAASCNSANSLTINFSDPAGTHDAYSASIDWGDGDTSNPTGISSGDVATHTYASAGPHTVTVTVSDEDGGTSASMTQTLVVNYNTTGILQPINPGPPTSVFKYGSTIPVKIKTTDCNGSYPSTLGPKVTYQKLSSGAPVNGELEPYSTSAADSGNTMRFDATNVQYIFNLASKSFGDPTSQWRIIITIPATGQKITADIGLKS